MALKSGQDGPDENTLGDGGRRAVAPAIRRLHVCIEPGPADHEVLWFDAVYPGESWSGLLQEDGLCSKARYATARLRVTARSDGCDGRISADTYYCSRDSCAVHID
jgi:hypothetical protein